MIIIFLVVSRIREFAAAGYSTQDAIREGITRTAGVITSAAVIMIAVFFVFGGLSFIEMNRLVLACFCGAFGCNCGSPGIPARAVDGVPQVPLVAIEKY